MSETVQQVRRKTYLGLAPFGAVLHLVVALAKHSGETRVGIRTVKSETPCVHPTIRGRVVPSNRE